MCPFLWAHPVCPGDSQGTTNTNEESNAFLGIKRARSCGAAPFVLPDLFTGEETDTCLCVKHPESSNSFLANRWRNHSSVKRLGVVLSEVKMCLKIWFWRPMHLFALSLWTLCMPGGDKVPYSSNLYTCEHFLWSNPYLRSKRGVCFWVSKDILKIWVLWFVSLISNCLCFETAKVVSVLGDRKSVV